MLVDMRQTTVEVPPASSGLHPGAPAEEAPDSVDSGRTGTLSAQRQAVERVIRAMSEHLDEPLSLGDMAGIAFLSPYHFNRIFRAITGIPPQKFQAALRMETAKRLILTTRLSVTDVCFEVGYSSLGTFTTHFTRYVGVPPRHLRRLAEDRREPALHRIARGTQHANGGNPRRQGVYGTIGAPDGLADPIFVGLFSTPSPESRPAGCAVLAAPGPYHITPAIGGCFYVFAAAFKRSEDPLAYLLPEDGALYVGASPGPVLVQTDQASEPVDVALRPAQITDPPLLMALPFLFEEQSCAMQRS